MYSIKYFKFSWLEVIACDIQLSKDAYFVQLLRQGTIIHRHRQGIEFKNTLLHVIRFF